MIETRRCRGRAVARTGIKWFLVQERRPSDGVETPRLTFSTAVASAIVRFPCTHPHKGLGHGRSRPAAMFHIEMRPQIPPADVASMGWCGTVSASFAQEGASYPVKGDSATSSASPCDSTVVSRRLASSHSPEADSQARQDARGGYPLPLCKSSEEEDR